MHAPWKVCQKMRANHGRSCRKFISTTQFLSEPPTVKSRQDSARVGKSEEDIAYLLICLFAHLKEEKKNNMHEPWSVCPKVRCNACRLHEKWYKWIHQNIHRMVRKHGLFQAEKQ
jgi:hypothetical protein